jgi:serine/threonine protein kinase
MTASNKLGEGIGLEKIKLILYEYPYLLNDYKNWSREEFINNIVKIKGCDFKTAELFVDNFKNFIKFYNEIKDNIEELVSEAFLEAWMQTVISEDTTHGKYIGKISRFYKDKSLTIDFNWTVGQIATFYITMENIPNSFSKLLERNGTIKGVQPKLKTLANLLVYLDKEYGFRHRDLHAGNVMFTEGWNLKLIDFGRCCMEYYYSPGLLGWYSMPRYGGAIPDKLESAVTGNGSLNKAYCFSLDILILIIYLLQDYKKLMNSSLKNMFYRAVRSRGGINLYEYCEIEAAKYKQPAFAHVYPWSFQHWNEKDIDILLDTPTVFLHGFHKFITDQIVF